MPVAHIALNVSHIPSATSFYLAALQPLGYRYRGQQGDSVGFGEKDAEFFLSQAPPRTTVTPTHIAFSANSSLQVRNCYAAALNAGGIPSGAPRYRCEKCFNAAVCDLDGNTFEVIFREGQAGTAASISPPAAPSKDTRITPSQQDVAESTVGDARSIAPSGVSKAKSRAEAAMDLASATSGSVSRSQASDLVRSTTSPAMPRASAATDEGKRIVGTLLGAAAGAAIVYAMCKSEQDNARAEADAAMAFARKNGEKAQKLLNYATGAVKERRNVNTTVSVHSLQRKYRGQLAREPATYDDNTVQDTISRYMYTESRLPAPSRRATAVEDSAFARSQTGGSSGFIAHRSTTMPAARPHYYLEGPKSSTSSRHGRPNNDGTGSELKRHDSGMSVGVQTQRPARSHPSRATKASELSRLSRSHAATEVQRSSTSKPSRSKYSDAPRARNASRPRHSHTRTARTSRSKEASAADKPLPPSEQLSKASSYMAAMQVPIPEGTPGEYEWETQTLMPEDSISCVGGPRPSPRTCSKSSRLSEAPSERIAPPARSRKHIAATLPTRIRENSSRAEREGKRS